MYIIRDILHVLLDEMDFLHITMTSHWARWRLKSPASQLFTQAFIQTQMKENIKAPRRWPLWGEFTAHRIHRSSVTSPHKGPASGKCFHLMTSSWIFTIISSTIIFYDLYCRQGTCLMNYSLCPLYNFPWLFPRQGMCLGFWIHGNCPYHIFI